MGEKIATRAVYGKCLVEYAGQYPELVVLDADLASATMTRDFAAAYPGRFFDMGIAEADMLADKGISARVLDFHTIKPLDTGAVTAAAKETGCIVATEEHSIIGGLGSAVAACCAENCPVPVVRHGVNDEFGRSGKAELVLSHYGLTAEVIAEKAELAIRLKTGNC